MHSAYEFYYLNFARIFTNNAKAFTAVGSIMGSLLEKIQVSIIFLVNEDSLHKKYRPELFFGRSNIRATLWLMVLVVVAPFSKRGLGGFII